jgi:hypothetical protein
MNLDERCRLDEKERITMMNNLKMKWADTNARYQRLSVALDLDSQKRRKERYSTLLLKFENPNRDAIRISDATERDSFQQNVYNT